MTNSTGTTNFQFNYNTIHGGLTITDYQRLHEVDICGGDHQLRLGQAAALYRWGNLQSGVPDPFGRYPIQIIALGGGLYGYVTVGGGLYTGYIGDNPNTPATETDTLASCMVLNDDYSQFTEGAQAALDATTTHEFAHAIQNGYGDPAPTKLRCGMNPRLPTWKMRFLTTPTATTSISGRSSAIRWAHGQVVAVRAAYSEYSNFLFFRHVAEHNGGTNVAGGGEDIMQHFWENVAAGQGALTAYNNALVTSRTDLADAFHRYAIAARFSKACGVGYVAPYCFEEGAAYVAFAGTPGPRKGALPPTPVRSLATWNDYAANWINLPTIGSPYQVALGNTSTGSKLRGSLVCDTGSALTIAPFASVVGPGNATHDRQLQRRRLHQRGCRDHQPGADFWQPQ